jgi:hypothetical protein
MLQKLGAVGIVGVLFLLGGVALVAVVEPIIAAGLALVVAGLGMMVYGLVTGFMQSMGLMGPPQV